LLIKTQKIFILKFIAGTEKRRTYSSDYDNDHDLITLASKEVIYIYLTTWHWVGNWRVNFVITCATLDHLANSGKIRGKLNVVIHVI